MKIVGRNASVRIIEAERLRHGIVLYGQVLSTDGHTWHLVKKTHVGADRFRYACTCPGNFLAGCPACKHIEALKQVEARR